MENIHFEVIGNTDQTQDYATDQKKLQDPFLRFQESCDDKVKENIQGNQEQTTESSLVAPERFV